MYKGKCRTFRCVIFRIMFGLILICHLSDLSRMYCERGARLKVPNPLPHRQMPMARARLVVK